MCLDGSQLIRILPPLRDQPNDRIRNDATPTFMESWRGFPVSNGYRANSHHDLFAYRHRDVSWEISDTTTAATDRNNRQIPHKYLREAVIPSLMSADLYTQETFREFPICETETEICQSAQEKHDLFNEFLQQTPQTWSCIYVNNVKLLQIFTLI